MMKFNDKYTLKPYIGKRKLNYIVIMHELHWNMKQIIDNMFFPICFKYKVVICFHQF